MPLWNPGAPSVTWATSDTCNLLWRGSIITAATTTVNYTFTYPMPWYGATNGQWFVYDENQAVVVPVSGILSAKTKRRYRKEQREAIRLQEEMNRAAAQRLQERQAATDRARLLLFSALTRDQQRSLLERQYFDMNVGGKTYRIKQGTHGNVRLVQAGVETMLYCAQPPDVPAEDAMLAQKLMLETDEPAFLRVANARVLARAA